jgi:hypothetical protein
MKIRLLPALIILSLTAGVFAQKPAKTPLSTAQRFIVKKQQLVDDFEMQLRDIPYAAVRIYIRYKLAEWLWKNGKDDSDRAETLAVKALEEVYARKEELANSHRYKLLTDIFGLLDANAKETSARLKAKYELDAEADLFSAFSQLSKKDGDQAVAQKLLKALSRPGDINNLVNPLVSSLRTMRSPQFPVVLAAFLDAVESGRVNVNYPILYMFLFSFDDPQVSPALRARYFALVVGRARLAANKPDPMAYQLITAAINSFGEGSPELLPEAMGLKNALAVTETAANRERREAQERIDASGDKLAATIAEAEKTEIQDVKRSFYLKAEILAKNSGRLAIGIDVVNKWKELDKSDFTKDWADQEYADIAKRAFEKDEVEIALRGIERVEDPIDRAEAWKNAAGYYDGKKDLPGARNAIGKMLKLLADGDRENGLRAQTLIRALPIVQRADKLSMPEAIAVTALAINDLPTPGVDDKAGTEKYADYVFTTMWINYSLAAAATVLLSHDKTDATDLAERIQKKEVRVVADLVLATGALDTAQKEAGKKAAEKKSPAPSAKP